MSTTTVNPRTVALERKVAIAIRAGELTEAIDIIRSAQHQTLHRRPVTFLNLPAELRNRIYDLSGCLQVKCDQKKKFGFVSTIHADLASLHKLGCPNDSGLSLIPVPLGMSYYSLVLSLPGTKSTRTIHSYNRSVAQQPDLTRVCRQVRAETLLVFYGTNHFVLNGDSHGASYRKWLRIIGPTSTALLRTVTLCLGKKPDRPDWQRQTIHFAKSVIQWLESELGQHATINVAWFQYHAPYFEDIDVSTVDLA
ncbi:hypothetical protein B0A48_18494 [Cryoendolithus antarcticus]|uniref:Uncharacterized protein n=1 Tax=Cryoendolithus antarcticus TaxID=1507870 RepID=A0A1V8S945_9PEZI|nr:hypothetical protein B0A48_18494 [Cryoendolithus antarcticus]